MMLLPLPPLGRLLSCLLLISIAFSIKAAPLNLPPTAIAEDTYLVATIDLTKLDPAAVEATAKAALGEKAGDVDELLGQYKTHYEKFAGKGAESVTIVLRATPDHHPDPEPIFYLKFKQGADHAAVEKQIRDEEGENNPQALAITHDGDFMVLRKKGTEIPSAAAEERGKLFTEAFGNSDKPAVAVLIFTDAMIKSIQKDLAHGAPPAFASLASDSKSIRIEAIPGDATKAEAVIDTADEDTAKRVAEAVTGLGDFLKMEATQMKQALVQLPPQALAQIGPDLASMKEMGDLMATIADALKPEQAGAKVTITADAKTVGALLRTIAITQKMGAANQPAAKGGL